MTKGVSPARLALFGVLLSALVGCQAATQQSPSTLPSFSSNSTATTPTATETPATTTPAGTDLHWTEAGSFGDGEAVEFASAVVHGASGFVAVGTHYDHGLGNFGPPPPHEGSIWVSQDGRSWADATPTDTFANAVLDHVLTTTDGSFIAIGRVTDPNREVPEDLGPLAAWESVDGLTWRRVESGLPADITVHEVEHGARGYVAAANAGLAWQLWLSADGRQWEQVYVAAAENGFLDVGAGEEGFVAVGSRPQVDSWETFVVASSDGRDWIGSPAPPTHASLVAPLGPDWIAIATGDYSERNATVWFSPNGLEWSQTGTIALKTIGSDPNATCFEFLGPLHKAAGWLVVGAAFSFPCSEGGVVTYGRTLISPDAISWQGLPFAEQDVILQGSNRGSVVLAASGADGGLVLVGQSNGRASFWFGESP